MKTMELADLERQTESLIDYYRQVMSDNYDLKAKHANLLREHFQLVQRVKQAESKLNTVLNRLQEVETQL